MIFRTFIQKPATKDACAGMPAKVSRNIKTYLYRLFTFELKEALIVAAFVFGWCKKGSITNVFIGEKIAVKINGLQT